MPAIRFRQGALADCVQWCERAVEEARGAGALAQLAHAYYLLHLAYTSLGSPERTRVRDLALPIYEELGDLLGQANTLNNLGIDAYYEGRWDDALDYYERSRRARERIGDVVGAATIANNIAEILSDQGLYDEAEALFEQVRRDVHGRGLTVDDGGRRRQPRPARGAQGLHEEAAACSRPHSPRSARSTLRRSCSRSRRGSPRRPCSRATTCRHCVTRRCRARRPRSRCRRRCRRCCTACAATPISRPVATRTPRANSRTASTVARSGDALYEVALSLRARSRLTGNAADAAEAQRLLDALHVVRVPDVPL